MQKNATTASTERPVNVLIVDDSALVRRALTEVLRADPRLHVMKAAADPYEAARIIAQQLPDVMVLDIEMPRMDGLTFLRKVMRQHPIPTVICSTLARRGSKSAFEASRLGAVDVIHKPRIEGTDVDDYLSTRLQDAVWAASQARVTKLQRRETPQRSSADEGTIDNATLHRVVIAIGASTGGTEALLVLLSQLPRRMPGIIVTQHMPEHFTKSFAQYLDEHCELKVHEAAQGDAVAPGHVLIAPGNHHMVIRGQAARYRVHLHDGPPVSRHRPSVDELFNSVAQYVGSDAVGIILTGMGSDGAEGMLEMKNQGARTIAQDEDSCVVFGMPREAIAKGGVDEVMSLDVIPTMLKRLQPRGPLRVKAEG
jgi:two-component system chemotaxis response regulator CheB